MSLFWLVVSKKKCLVAGLSIQQLDSAGLLDKSNPGW
jgi:hypothetical protein